MKIVLNINPPVTNPAVTTNTQRSQQWCAKLADKNKINNNIIAFFAILTVLPCLFKMPLILGKKYYFLTHKIIHMWRKMEQIEFRILQVLCHLFKRSCNTIFMVLYQKYDGQIKIYQFCKFQKATFIKIVPNLTFHVNNGRWKKNFYKLKSQSNCSIRNECI
jgi:hypothetical protein